MIKGFKDFVLRGNLIELAVAFVIGAAFAKVVQDFVGAIITPLINSLPGAKVDGFGFSLRSGKDFIGKDGTNTTFINLSTVINSLIVFLATAAVVYFILIAPMNKFNERRKRGDAPADVPPTDLELLTEIRDLLKSQQDGGSRPSPSPSPSPTP